MNALSDFTRRFAGIVALALVLALGFSSVATAQESSRETYSGQQPFVAGAGGGGGGGGGSADTADPGSLPFTGLDLGLAAGGALLLIGAGAALAAGTGRRPSTRES